MAEKQVPLPLSGEEVRNAILWHVNESLIKSCNLSDSNAYSSFKGSITINLSLSDFGREVTDNHIVNAQEGLLTADAKEATATVTIEPAAPNQVRVDTHQDVPVKTIEDGKQVIKRVKYQLRKDKK